jgi:sugar phosphate isomerase/epimerase
MSNVAELSRFVNDAGFACVDIPDWPLNNVKEVADAGLKLGTVQLPQPWGDLTSGSAEKRSEAIARCTEYAASLSDHGARTFFACVFQEEGATNRRKSMDQAIEGYGGLCEAFAKLPGGGARIVLEGWPGPSPHLPVLACTPEGYRALLDGAGAENLGVNFDPSHLIRMGIDSVRFAEEFASRIYHAHAKDTEILGEGLYEYGTSQEATTPPDRAFGDTYWRYTIPGHGCARWGRLLEILAGANYKGRMTIELEDMNFNGSEAGEKRGFIASRQFLENV